MKIGKILLAWTLTLCLIIAPFSGSLVFALNNETGPIVTTNIDPLAYVDSDTLISVEYTAQGDSTLVSCDTRLEGTSLGTEATISFTPAQQGLTNGVYTLVMEATDSNGEQTINSTSFYVVDKLDIGFTYAEDESIVPNDPDATAAYHEVTPLSYTMGYGSTSNGAVALDDILPYDANAAYSMQYANVATETSSVSGIPYETFEIDLNGKTDGEVIVRYTGSTLSGERIAVKVYNPTTNAWDMIGSFIGSESISEAIDVATYAHNDAIHVMAVLDYVTNGSDTMIWSTDPQHYTKFEDLHEYYYQIYQFAAEQYTNGEAGYIITTGDLVDDRPSASVAAAQWKVADQAMSYIEAVGMPNGLETGNHCVGDYKKPDYSDGPNTSSDYSKFFETFPASRYNREPWYGGSLNNNTSHYDLVTIGNVDFIILYLGYGMEATDETIVWANDVLAKYSHRTAIVATHQYLDAGEAQRSPQSRADLIFNAIVDPNPNVKMVICGHDDGSLCLEKTASDGRTVYEVLADYQFVEAEDPDFYKNEHYIGSVGGCCGDGYIRLMTVTGDTLSSITYSPVTGRYNPYGDRENISIDLDCGAPTRYISTVSFSAYVLGDEVEASAEVPTAIVIQSEDSTTYHHVSYLEIPAEPESTDMISIDISALEQLIDEASAWSLDGYTEDSVNNLQAAIQTASQAIANGDDAAIKEAYIALANAAGELSLIKEVIDPATLSTLHNYDMTLSKWVSNDASVPLTNNRSHITATQTEAGGIHMERSAASTNTWPSARTTVKDIVIKPVNGKIYANLDVDANSAWCIYMDITQGSLAATVRLNFAIENAFNNKDSDGFEGEFKGVYDVTEAFTANGIDPTATMKISRTILYIVPGDVTYDYIELMTDYSDAPVDTSALEDLLTSIASLDESIYTTSSWALLEDAVSDAQKVLNDEASAQSDINLAVSELKKVYNKLKKLEDVIPEPEGSLLPSDEGEWMQGTPGTMNIYRDENNYTVLQNTNSQWPQATYTSLEPYVVSVADHQIAVDMTVASEGSILLLINKSWITINKYITSNTNSAGDLKSGTYTVNIPLSTITQLATADTASFTGVRVFSVGAADQSAVTIRQLQIIDYVAPPPVYNTTTDLLPASIDDTFSPSTSGSHEVLEDGTLVIHSPAEGYRVQILPTEKTFYDMTVLNAIHMAVDSDVPFKVAFNPVSNTDNSGQWITTSGAMYGHLFTVTDDRAAAGAYDVYMEAKAHCPGITDKTNVYMDSVTIVTTGEGTLTLSKLDAVEYDTYEWDEDMTNYGPAATPTNPYYAHCAKEAPTVETKVDLLAALGLEKYHSVTGWQTYGGQQLGLQLDLSKTPYLYYSIAQPADSNFTFALYNNNTNAPWLLFRDATGEGPYMNQGAANWDSYGNREQYVLTSETGCIDMRQYLKNPSSKSWIVNQVNFYNSIGKNVIISYMFFGSAPIDGVRGDVNDDGNFNTSDAFAVYSVVAGNATSTTIDTQAADLNKDGIVNIADALIAYKVSAGMYDWDYVDTL